MLIYSIADEGEKKEGNNSNKYVVFPLYPLSQYNMDSHQTSLCCSGTMTKCWSVLEKPPPRRLWFIFHAALANVLTLAVKLQMILFHAMSNCVFPYVVSSPIENGTLSTLQTIVCIRALQSTCVTLMVDDLAGLQEVLLHVQQLKYIFPYLYSIFVDLLWKYLSFHEVWCQTGTLFQESGEAHIEC